MIIQTISTAGQFRDQFARMGRKDQFSYQALGLLFEYFDDADEQIELDVISICCDFREMDAAEVRDGYRIDDDTNVEEYLNENTILIGKTADGFYVFAQF
jgi:hypothetical protein